MAKSQNLKQRQYYYNKLNKGFQNGPHQKKNFFPPKKRQKETEGVCGPETQTSHLHLENREALTQGTVDICNREKLEISYFLPKTGWKYCYLSYKKYCRAS